MFNAFKLSAKIDSSMLNAWGCGVEYSCPEMGKIASVYKDIPDRAPGYYVFPYCFPPYEKGMTFQSGAAAEHYVHALAHEMLFNKKG
jgi:hypothetical protein